jgi:hypothetical protein
MDKVLRTVPIICCLLLLMGDQSSSQPTDQVDVGALPSPAKKKIDFARDIAPLLRERCETCHGAEKQMGGLRLDNREAALAGGYSGSVIKPGNSAESRLIHLVSGLTEELIMPMTGAKLTSEQVGLLRAWIDQGAEWSEQAAAVPEVGNREKPKTDHWAYLPPRRPPVPKVQDRAWLRNPLDAFVLAKLEDGGIQPSPEADRATLIRRVSLDLIGLPPTPEEVDQFLTDTHPDVYERLVDRLLASPHYGEKWARHWLDLARYADSDGYEKDLPRPHAWRWRDWVIHALNSNMPFDQFTIEQLAGDLLPNPTVEQKVATGFNRNTLTNREGGIDLEEFRVEEVVDRTNTLGTVWLGLTVGCARCHDHKYDPTFQKEYYQLYAFFNSAQKVNIEAPLAGEMGPFLSRKSTYDRKWRELLEDYDVPEMEAEWEKNLLEAVLNPGANEVWDFSWGIVEILVDGAEQILRLNPSQRTQKQQDQLTEYFIQWYGTNMVPGVSKDEHDKLKFKELWEKREQLKEKYPGLSEAQIFVENPSPPKTHILIRGDFRRPGVEVYPDTPRVLPPLPGGAEPPRLQLARWLVSGDHPLTARVTVNRMWQEFFGRGLVETSEDFGTRGELPTHPELLDWLAVEFMDNGWNVKKTHRLLVTSATYRQSSKIRGELQGRDPYNKLLARQSRFRLSAELIRDVALSASGLLNPAIGGKSIRPPQPAGMVKLGFASDLRAWREDEGADRYRRGLYIFFQRTVPYPQLINFDAPDSLLACSRRGHSTTPLQALNLLNDPVFFEAAQGLAARVLREKQGSVADRIDYAFRLCLARLPKPRERERLLRHYHQQKEILGRDPKSIELLFPANGVEGVDPSEAAAWVGVSRVLLNLEEFITRG